MTSKGLCREQWLLSHCREGKGWRGEKLLLLCLNSLISILDPMVLNSTSKKIWAIQSMGQEREVTNVSKAGRSKEKEAGDGGQEGSQAHLLLILMT